ncbi:MAG: hypothetical protein LBS39_04590 [Campylobacteraceae bacterium]|nr:hypothetical protein [Campylobacteraceae bacterium]
MSFLKITCDFYGKKQFSRFNLDLAQMLGNVKREDEIQYFYYNFFRF